MVRPYVVSAPLDPGLAPVGPRACARWTPGLRPGLAYQQRASALRAHHIPGLGHREPRGVARGKPWPGLAPTGRAARRTLQPLPALDCGLAPWDPGLAP